MGRFYQTSDAINLVAATKYSTFGVIEYCVFVKDLVDGSATTDGVILAKYIPQITQQQGRDAVGHGLSRCQRQWKVAARIDVPIVFNSLTAEIRRFHSLILLSANKY